MWLLSECHDLVIHRAPVFGIQIAVTFCASGNRLRKDVADPVAAKIFGKICSQPNLMPVALIYHYRQAGGNLTARQQCDRKLHAPEAAASALFIVNGLIAAGETDSHACGRMPVDRWHDAPHVSSIRDELVLYSALGQSVD